MSFHLALGPLEREILILIWKKKCVTVNCVLPEINKVRKKNDQLAYTTVMTILKRLVDKEVLKREKDGRTYAYKPQTPKQEFIDHIVSQTISEMVDIYGEAAKGAFKQQVQFL